MQKPLHLRNPGSPMTRTLCCFSDIDGTMVGDHHIHDRHTERFKHAWTSPDEHCKRLLVYNTGRSLASYQSIAALKSGVMPEPTHLICGVGTRIFGQQPGSPGVWVEDSVWTRHLDEAWDLLTVQRVLDKVIHDFGASMVKYADKEEHHQHKQTLILAPGLPTSQVAAAIESALLSHGVRPLLVHGAASHEVPGFVDVLPGRAGKGAAAEYLRRKLQLAPEDCQTQCVVAGDAFNDIQMLEDPRWHAIVVGNAVPAVHLWAKQQLSSARPGADLTIGNRTGQVQVVGGDSTAAGQLVISARHVAAGLLQAMVFLGFLPDCHMPVD